MQKSYKNHSEFASPELALPQEVADDAYKLAQAIETEALGIVCTPLMILNEHRQVIFKNNQLMQLLGATSDEAVIGKRPGDLFNCKHAQETEGGCGTTVHCRNCGAVRAILKAQRNLSSIDSSCRIITLSGDELSFRIWAVPYHFENRNLTLFGFSEGKLGDHRNYIQECFFRQITEILSLIRGNSKLITLKGRDPYGIALSQSIGIACDHLIQQVDNQRQLLKATYGNLNVRNSRIVSTDVIRIIQQYKSASNQGLLCINPNCEHFELVADPNLLISVLRKMTENALEASDGGQIVVINAKRVAGEGVFSVHNSSTIPPSDQPCIFNFGFTTKGIGRGFGTYSLKLIGENHLNGHVWFESTELKGTTFYISVPLNH